jgi:hypothetical protein
LKQEPTWTRICGWEEPRALQAREDISYQGRQLLKGQVPRHRMVLHLLKGQNQPLHRVV